MSISIAHSRQHLSSLIDAAQTAPQIITKRNAPVAVLVSPDYFKRTEHAAGLEQTSFYDKLVALRASYAPVDDIGLAAAPRSAAWSRANDFSQNDD
jgi:prevent-host-death family protein